MTAAVALLAVVAVIITVKKPGNLGLRVKKAYRDRLHGSFPAVQGRRRSIIASPDIYLRTI
jgi:hypothetical protein